MMLLMAKWSVLLILSAAQFLMVLDAAVMNVSISQLVEDFDTDVTTIQAVITFYSLVMAALMITGGKLGDLWGRKRVFLIGHVVYGAGSLLTAVSQTVPQLAAGWSVLEGIGAAMVMPALAALAGGIYQGRDRALAYGVLGGVAGVGIAVGPILGGWMTTYYSWRLVFAGEVIVAMLIIVGTWFLIDELPREKQTKLDVVGAVLCASGLGLIVYGVLQASTWGWLKPHNSPIEPFGLALTPFVVAAGGILLWAFRWWQGYREEHGQDPLVHFALFTISSLRSGLAMFLAQNTIMMGIFFVIPLYLQIVQGYNAFDTGVKMLPISVMLFLSSLGGSVIARFIAPRALVRLGVALLALASFFMLATIEPEIDTVQFAIASAVLGLGVGLISSQLGNVVQSAVGESDRSEAGGLQYTSMQLGSSLGTALIGAVVITGLATAFANNVSSDERISGAVEEEVGVRLESGDVSFVSSAQVEEAAEQAGLRPGEVDAIVENYEEAQLDALKLGLLVAAFIAIGSFAFTGALPSRRLEEPSQAAESAVSS
jgi:EmrB/QacA subfamily drug resistance transporter